MLETTPRNDEHLLDWDEPAGQTRGSGWTPPDAEVTRHNGEPLPPDMQFFEPPQPEIGRILTADSTLKASQAPRSTLSRLLLIGFAGSAVFAGLGVLEVPSPLDLLAGLLAAGLVALVTRFRHQVSYVGTEGVARFVCKARPDRVVRRDVFPFAEAVDLIASQTVQYYNGIYTGTAYSFTWRDEKGKKRYKLSGSYHGEKKPPKSKSPFHFAQSAELAWSLRLFLLLLPELEQQGRVVFPLGGKNHVAIGPGFLEFSHKDGPQRWTAGEIREVQIADGNVKFKHVDAKEGWFRSEGVFSFAYNQMPNARMFLIALDRLLMTSPDG